MREDFVPGGGMKKTVNFIEISFVIKPDSVAMWGFRCIGSR